MLSLEETHCWPVLPKPPAHLNPYPFFSLTHSSLLLEFLLNIFGWLSQPSANWARRSATSGPMQGSGPAWSDEGYGVFWGGSSMKGCQQRSKGPQIGRVDCMGKCTTTAKGQPGLGPGEPAACSQCSGAVAHMRSAGHPSCSPGQGKGEVGGCWVQLGVVLTRAQQYSTFASGTHWAGR